ncbi:MAG TPA: rod shape-determining protein MreC [Terriglobales bacterium]|nr:rod shape-determining protein MreC [Terriglobales bacterium]
MLHWEKRKSFLILGGLVLLHLLLISVQVPRGAEKKLFERAVFAAFSPFQKAAVSAFRGLRAVWTDYFDLRRVRVENQALKRELFFLEQENKVLADGLTRFRSEAEVRDSLEAFRKSLIPARVVGTDSENYYRALVIDRGTRAGVRPDMPVCDRYGNLVGRTIAPVSADEAMVQLITDPDSGVSVVSATDKIVGILSGKQGNRCVMKYILATVKGGQEGEDLLTTGFDKIYPAGLHVGHIVSIRPTADVFKEIGVLPYFSYATLDIVAVLPGAAPGGRK